MWSTKHVPSNDPDVGALVGSSAGLAPVRDRVRTVDADVVAEGDSGSSTSDIATTTVTSHPDTANKDCEIAFFLSHRSEFRVESDILAVVARDNAWSLGSFHGDSRRRLRATKCWQ